MKKVILLSLFAAFSLSVRSQNAIRGTGTMAKMSLVQAVDIAIKNNLNVKASELAMQSAELNRQQAKNNQLPNLVGNINEAASFGRSINPYTNGYDSRNINYNNLSFNASLLLFNGGQLRNSVLQNDWNVKASAEDLQAAKDNIALQVALSYLNILNAEDQLMIAQSQSNITKLQILRTQKLVDAGSLPITNVLDLKAQLANEEANVVNFQSTLDLQRLTFMQLLNDPSIDGFQLERMDLAPPKNDKYEAGITEIYNKALENQALIKAANYRVLSAEKSILVSKAGMLPSLSLNSSWSANQSNALKNRIIQGTQEVNLGVVNFNGSNIPLTVSQPKIVEGETVGYFDQIRNTQNKVIGLNLNIPIFGRFAARTRVKQATLNKMNAEIEVNRTKLTLRQNIEQAYVNMNNAAKRYEATAVQVKALEESFRASESRFNAGTIDFVNYNLQKTNLDKARLSLIQAKYDYIFRIKVLDFYQGKNISFN